MVEDYDDPDLQIDISSELSGRVIFTLNGIGKGYSSDTEISFYCGPETRDGYLEDTNDCGLYAQLEELLKEYQPHIGTAENLHAVYVPAESDANKSWEDIKKLLVEAGAVEMK